MLTQDDNVHFLHAILNDYNDNEHNLRVENFGQFYH